MFYTRRTFQSAKNDEFWAAGKGFLKKLVYANGVPFAVPFGFPFGLPLAYSWHISDLHVALAGRANTKPERRLDSAYMSHHFTLYEHCIYFVDLGDFHVDHLQTSL